uniref:Uncharacterized protein n=1 Tax=Mandrillus leucophaeus TaxID=9568 RepID=A0A2K5XNA1_MANLE
MGAPSPLFFNRPPLFLVVWTDMGTEGQPGEGSAKVTQADGSSRAVFAPFVPRGTAGSTGWAGVRQGVQGAWKRGPQPVAASLGSCLPTTALQGGRGSEGAALEGGRFPGWMGVG